MMILRCSGRSSSSSTITTKSRRSASAAASLVRASYHHDAGLGVRLRGAVSSSSSLSSSSSSSSSRGRHDHSRTSGPIISSAVGLNSPAVAAVTSSLLTSKQLHVDHIYLHQPPQRSLSSSAASGEQEVLELVQRQPINITLYQYKICPFCNRVKALLDYIGLQYNTIEVNPLFKTEIKQLSKTYRKVPIITISSHSNNSHNSEKDATTTQPQETIFGSDEIINTLLQHPYIIERLEDRWKNRNNNNSSMSLSLFNGDNNDVITKWSNFAIEELAVLLYPNMCKTYDDSYKAFQYVHHSDNTNLGGYFQKYTIQYVGAAAMYMAASRVKKKRNISDEKVALDDALRMFVIDGLDNGNKTFLSSNDTNNAQQQDNDNEPNLADINIFGVLRSLEGLPIHHEIILQNYNNHQNNNQNNVLLDWYRRMMMKTENMSNNSKSANKKNEIKYVTLHNNTNN